MNHLARNSAKATALVGIILLGLLGDTTSRAASTDSLAARLGSHLVVLDKNGTFKPLDAGALKSIKYFAFYHSASWCAPCRIFTPKLVKFYNDFKPTHPDFELIFVSHDAGSTDMLGYMKSDAMTWPAVRYDDIDASKLDDMDPEGGIPDLILTDADGKILSNTFQGDNYVGPDKVLDDIKRIVP